MDITICTKILFLSGWKISKFKKFKKTKNDVNFVRNLGLDDLPSGFGAFKTDKEIDMLTKVEGT